MKFCCFFLLLILVSSCKDNPKADEVLMNQIQGSWSSNLAVFNPPTYYFKKDSLYNNDGYYDGYYEIYGNREHKKFIPTKFLGNSIKFDIKDSTIHYYDSINKPTPLFKILSINKEEMVVKYENDYRIDTLGKRDNLSNIPLDYDQIIYTTSGCYGSCAILNLSLSKNGTIISANEAYNGKKGVFAGKLDPKFHQFLEKKINEADLLHLNNNYAVNITDAAEELLLVIKNQKIIKSIRVYAHYVNPSYTSLVQTLSAATSLIQNQKRYHETEYFPLLSLINMNEKQLSKAQTFLFWTELIKHPTEKVVIKNKQTYKTDFYYYYFGGDLGKINPCKLESIKGNGQQFELTFENNQRYYYDLGYNFNERYLN